MERFMMLDEALARLNEEASAAIGMPWLRADEYAHFTYVRALLAPYAQAVNLPGPQRRALLWFCYRDTAALAAQAAPFDPRLVALRYIQHFCYRSGNRDTPDDQPEKLDMELLSAYRDTREKAWRGQPLTAADTALLREPGIVVLAALQQEADRMVLPR